MASRKIFKSATTAHASVRDVLALVFAQELLAPSRDVFIVAPWITNVPILDNRLGGFDALNPEWGKRHIPLVEVLGALAARGASLHIYTRPARHNATFETRLDRTMQDSGVAHMCRFKTRDRLHTKGLLTDRVLIDGSMNLTISGISVNDESVGVSFDGKAVAEARVHYDSYEQP